MEKTATIALAEGPAFSGGLVRLPAGSFVMGDDHADPQERPAHEVYVESFWAAKYCVTAGEYCEFVVAAGDGFDELWCDFINPCFIRKQGRHYRLVEGAENYPMMQVSFTGAAAYCNWLSREHGLKQVYDLGTLNADLSRSGFRLLTEQEWEYACGGPEQHKYGHGPEFRPDLVNYRGYSGAAAHLRAGRSGGFGPHDSAPLPAGALPPNGFGLYEMLGNVNEWCHDIYGPYSTAATRQKGQEAAGSFRVIRGGSFMDGEDKMRKSYRHAIHYRSKCMVDGFRIARNA